MTTSRSVRLSRSTSGRAPSISSSMRFWIRAVSLNRPPTLFTISSLLRASIMVLKCSRLLVFDNPSNLGHGTSQVVVDHHVIKRPTALGHVNFTLCPPEPPGDVLDRVAGPGVESRQ